MLKSVMLDMKIWFLEKGGYRWIRVKIGELNSIYYVSELLCSKDLALFLVVTRCSLRVL